MAMIITGGESTALAFTHGLNALRPQEGVFERVTSFASNLVGSAANFGNQMIDMFNNYYSQQAYAQAEAALNNTGAIYSQTMIQPLLTVESYQSTNSYMQQMMMANPMARQQFYDQKIFGYADSYVDTQPGEIGKWHDDYRVATTGMLMFDGEPNEAGDNWKVSTYFDPGKEGARPLTFSEKSDIHYSWQNLEAILESRSGEDPTSPYGDKF